MNKFGLQIDGYFISLLDLSHSDYVTTTQEEGSGSLKLFLENTIQVKPANLGWDCDADTKNWQLQFRTEKKTSVVTEACHLSSVGSAGKNCTVEFDISK